MSEDRPGEATGDQADLRERKRALRAAVRDARRRADPEQRAALASAWSDRVLTLLTETIGSALDGLVVAAYVSYGTEPPTGDLLADLDARGARVLVPVLEPDRDLDWCTWRDGTATDQLLGRHAIGTADLVVVPALLAAVDGARLGQGGGSYDRALARVRTDAPIVALVHDDEVRAAAELPTESHDRGVTHVVTPTRTVRASAQVPPSAPSA
jgi:5-formyltetrahydrofolate cyclo-ligase